MNCQGIRTHYVRAFAFVPLLIVALAGAFTTACGGGGNQTLPTLSGNTAVTLLASSSANGQLGQFSITLSSLTLTSQSGKTVSVLTSPVGDDYMHLNGTAEPLTTATIPQDVYTSATATVSSAYPACAGQTAGMLLVDETLNGPVALKSTVNLAQPITVTGTAMGLILDLQVSPSAPFAGGCSMSLNGAVPVSAVFNLSPVVIATQPSNISNGKLPGLHGVVGSVDPSGTSLKVNAMFTTNGGNAPTWEATINSSTIFQGINGASALASGMPVDLDLVLQPSGAMMVTRIDVLDTNVANLGVLIGRPLAIYSQKPSPSYPQVTSLIVEQQGNVGGGLMGGFDFANAVFQVSRQATNLQNLPFAPAFDGTTMVDGQNVAVSTHMQLSSTSPPTTIPQAATVTLMPQTINGTLSAISSSGAFTTYTVALAGYDMFPNLAVQPGQPVLLPNPGTVVVYADSNTQNLTAKSAAVGAVLRFRGFVFNDNGTLRMDCLQLQDGVAE